MKIQRQCGFVTGCVSLGFLLLFINFAFSSDNCEPKNPECVKAVQEVQFNASIISIVILGFFIIMSAVVPIQEVKNDN